MKIFKLPQLADLSDNGEFLLGRHDLGSTSAYMLYGRLRPKEAAKKVSTQIGNEEIIFMLKGSMRVRSGKSTFTVSAGEAFFSKEAQQFYLDNPEEEEAIYITAGAKSGEAGIAAQAKNPDAATDEQIPDDIQKPESLKEEASEEDFEITRDEDEDTTEGIK